jgi:hypothetical protein
VMTSANPAEVRKYYGKAAQSATGNLIADAYIYFYEEIEAWLTQDGSFEKRVDVLFHTLSDCIRLVAIDLEVRDDAQLIFETLNARGTPLLPSDLVKNHLFHKAEVKDQAGLQDLYSKYWEPFDIDMAFWREEQGRGHARRYVIDTFLLYYLVLKTEDDVPADHLYAAFREYLDGSKSQPIDVLQDLRNYSQLYRELHGQRPDPREQLFYSRLKTMDVLTAYPFLLGLESGYKGSRNELRKVLIDLESWLVRRMVCHLTTRGYGHFFVDLLATLKKGQGDLSTRCRAALLSSSAEGSRWPDDAEFEEAWHAAPLYRSLVQGRIRMILEALESHTRSAKTEEVAFPSYPIEHLMPQGWRSNWPIDAVGEQHAQAAAKRDVIVHTMGNLTLLTTQMNSTVSNGPWVGSQTENPGKKAEILKFSNLALNQLLQKENVWDEAAIERRGRTLFAAAKTIWPRPASPKKWG